MELLEFAERYTAAWCGGNPEAVAEFFSLDGSLTINGGFPAAGRAAIRETARAFMTAFPDLRVTMEGLNVDGPRITYRWTLEGTSADPRSDGRRVRISGRETWHMEGGLIARSLGEFDEAEYRRQLDGIG